MLLLTTSQASCLGLKLGKLSISAIAQADDCLLISNDIFFSSYLARLTEIFCSKYMIELSPDKIKLQAFVPPRYDIDSIVKIGDKPIQLSSVAEHVGVLRSIAGNGPTQQLIKEPRLQ